MGSYIKQYMKKLSTIFFFILSSFALNAQKKQVFTGYFSAGANIMAYDRFINYTHAGIGAGLQVYHNSKHKLKPQLDISGNLFSSNKILFVFEDGQTTGPKQFILTTFAGFVYTPLKYIELGITAGPSFVEHNVHAGVKPSVGYYFGKKNIVKANVSLTHIFERDDFSKKNSGFISFGFAAKLF
jgi:hypothetical protein